MAVKELLARVQHKRDTSENWETTDPVLLNGEIIIVDTANGKMRTKTGDGQKKYSQLTFDDEEIYKAISLYDGNGIAAHPYTKAFTEPDWHNGTITISASEHRQDIVDGAILAKVYMLLDGVYSSQCLAAMDTAVSVGDDKSIILSYDGAPYSGKFILVG